MLKDVEELGKEGEVRKTAGTEGPSMAYVKNLSQLPTTANLPGPFSSFKMIIPAIHKP